jgi:uncharacterized protein YbjT (DUF2867 family)
MKIAVAGASGFVGGRLVAELLKKTTHDVVALSRSGKAPNIPRLQGISIDFFSLYCAEIALQGCDIAFYLLHSMIPSNRLSQGSFEDFDFILADNFARAAQSAGVKKIIYVGGIVDDSRKDLSQHLRSRLEVERVLAAYGIPVTTIRCSLVIGAEGSSFLILKKLVSRLPSMLLPEWCNTPCQPVAIDDVIKSLCLAVESDKLNGRCIDLGAPELLTYRTLIEMTAAVAGLKRTFISIPAIPVSLSKLWVMLVTGASRSLVSPLVDSLNHPMTVRHDHKINPELLPDFVPIRDALQKALTERPITASNVQLRGLSSQPSREVIDGRLVKSVQRLPQPENTDALRIARYYFSWLSRFFNGIVNVKNSHTCSYFYLIFFKKPMLELTFSPNRSTPDRQLFYITGGFLAAKQERGRLEFRESPIAPCIFAAIHDYRPALPWWIYRTSQAPFHAFVMWSFGKFLSRVDLRNKQRKARAKS